VTKSPEWSCPFDVLFSSLLCMLQGGSNMTGTINVQFTDKSVPVVFEPPCTFSENDYFHG
jgi:hypothetical protein